MLHPGKPFDNALPCQQATPEKRQHQDVDQHRVPVHGMLTLEEQHQHEEGGQHPGKDTLSGRSLQEGPYPPEHGHAAGQPAEQASLTPPVPRQWIGQTENGDKNLPRQPHPPFSSIFFTTASTTSPTVRTERKSSATRR